ncbi:unnamed protein product, partial [Ixodes pacificus]
ASTRTPEVTEHHIQASVGGSPPPECSSGQPVLRSPGEPGGLYAALPEPGFPVEPDPGPPLAVSPGPAGPDPGSAVDPGLPVVVQGHSISSKSAGAQPPQPSDLVFHPPRASTPLGSRPSSISS